MSEKCSLSANDDATGAMALKPESLPFYIVSELYQAPLTLMELQDQIAERIGYHPSEGTLYGTASRLKTAGYLETEKTEIVVKKQRINLRMYRITSNGKAALLEGKKSMEKELSYLNGILNA